MARRSLNASQCVREHVGQAVASLLAEAEFVVEAAELHAGDKLIAYTDGVTEAQNPAGEFFGRKRLREVAVEYARAPHIETHDAILRAVQEFTQGAEQGDDITLFLMEYRP